MVDFSLISRKEAQSAGLKRFFTGVPCGRGHVCEKTVANFKCVECHREDAINTRRENPEKIKRAQVASNAANREKVLARGRAWRETNRDHRLTSSRADYANKREYYCALSLAWQQANPDFMRARASRRRAAVQNAEGSHDASDIARIRLSQNDLCVYCQVDLAGSGHADHIMPLVLGGSNWPENIQLLCRTCNCRKQASHPEDFERRIGFVRALPQLIGEAILAEMSATA